MYNRQSPRYSRYTDRQRRKKRMRRKCILTAGVVVFVVFSASGWGLAANTYHRRNTTALSVRPAAGQTAAQQTKKETAPAAPERTAYAYERMLAGNAGEAPAARTIMRPVYSLSVNGVDTICTYDKEALLEALKTLKAEYAQALIPGHVLQSRILEDIQITETDIPADTLYITQNDELVFELKNSCRFSEEYKTEPGDTKKSAAKKLGITVAELEKNNPGIIPFDKLPEGLALSGGEAQPVLTVQTEIRYEIKEPIPYPTEYIDDDSMYIGSNRVEKEGLDGEKALVYTGTFVNLEQTGEVFVEEKVVRKAVPEQVRRGIKSRYEGKLLPGNDGTIPEFMFPVTGRISSYYGWRRDRMHYGIDIPTPTGTPVAASLGGTVTYASERGNYGLLVEIDHGNGFKTRYGHNSKIHVAVGQTVGKGETIALVGETGNAACPHVHFEIRLNDRAVDPYPYLIQ